MTQELNEETTARRTRSDGERSRDTILDAAAELATIEGLDGLSLGRLAKVTGMSKSGVFGLFGSKEELQIATVEKARQVFITEVIRPALEAAPGRDQLHALCVGYLDHVERRVFPGGCFFASVASEVSSQPGPVRDHVADEQRQWTDLLTENVKHAIDSDELPPDTDPGQLTVELSTMLTGADIAYLLHEDPTILETIRNSIKTKLGL